MIRRITLLVDDEQYRHHALIHSFHEASVALGDLIGPMRREGQRTDARAALTSYGVRLESDEQL